MAKFDSNEKQNALVLLYPKSSDQKKPFMATKRYRLSDYKDVGTLKQFTDGFSERHSLQDFAKSCGVLQMDVKIYGRSFQKTKEFPDGRQSLVGNKEELFELFEDIETGTHELLVKVYEKEIKMFMEVTSAAAKVGKSPDKGVLKRSHENVEQDASEGAEPAKKKRSSKVESAEDNILKTQLENGKDVTRTERQEKLLAEFQTKASDIKIETKWSVDKSEEECPDGTVSAKVLSELFVICPGCGQVQKLHKLRNIQNLRNHTLIHCSRFKAKRDNKKFSGLKLHFKPAPKTYVVPGKPDGSGPSVSKSAQENKTEEVIDVSDPDDPEESEAGFGDDTTLKFTE